MNVPVNPPHLQAGHMTFGAVCAFGSAIAIGGLITLRPGSEQWWTGALGELIILGGLVPVELGWLWIQREVTVSDGRIIVRRWIDAIRGRPGISIPIDGETRISITLENLRLLRIERDGRTGAVLTLGYWDPLGVRDLVDALRANGVQFAQY